MGEPIVSREEIALTIDPQYWERSDLRALASAFKKGWPIPAEKRRAIIRELQNLLAYADTRPRTVIAARLALAAATAVEQAEAANPVATE